MKLNQKLNFTIFILFALVINIYTFKTFAKDFPTSEVLVLNKPSPGVTFVGSNLIDASIYDNYGMVTTPEKWKNLSNGSDFKIHKNGKISYFSHYEKAFIILDENLNVLDTFKCKKGKNTDFHDIQMKDDGTVLLYNNYTKLINMSLKVAGGEEQATIYGHTIQEIDKNKNLIWEWDTFDKLDVTEANKKMDLTQKSIDYVHINSIIYDSDGNIIISCRSFDELIKINRTTGAIMWRMGGKQSKNNQFNFINDTDDDGNWGFSAQHTPVRMSNGNILLFDNGNLKDCFEKYSRAVEYKVDELNKTATKVWEFRMTPDMYISFMGSVQELNNGNIFISFGKRQVEVNKNKDILFDMVFNQNNPTYRAYKYIYDLDFKILNVNKINSYSFNDAQNDTNINLKVDSLEGSGEVTVLRYPYTAHNAVFLDVATPLKVMPVRYVIQKSPNISKMKYQITIDTKNIIGFSPGDSIYVFYRNKESVGGFEKILTNYVDGIKSLVANIPDEGEIVLASMTILGKVDLSLPKDKAEGIAINTDLIWDKLLDTKNYQIQLSKDSLFRTNIIIDTVIKSTNYTISNLENYQDYYWKVRGLNDTNIGGWSDTFKFKTIIAEPVPKNPENNAYFVNPTGFMEWTRVAGALSYRVQVSLDQYFSVKLVDEVVSTKSEYNYKALETNKTYYWRVQSIRNQYTSQFSTILKFTTKLSSPILRFPDNDIKFLTTNYKFVWFNTAGAMNYHFELYIDTLDKFKYFYHDTLETTEINIENLKFNQVYYWRVRAKNLQNYSNWSEFFKFETKIAIPKQYLPTNGSTKLNNVIKLEWFKNPGSDFEKLEIYKTTDTNLISSSNLVLDTTIFNTNSIILNNLDFTSKYFWRIKSNSQHGITEWSSLWYFETRAVNVLTTPSLILPNNNEVLSTNLVNLKWFTQNSLNYKYNLQVSLVDNFTSIILDTILESDNKELYLPNNNSEYYWRVASVAGNIQSEWSKTRNFIVCSESKILPIAKLILPENKTQLDKNDLKLIWNYEGLNNTMTLDNYRIIISNVDNFENVILKINNVLNNEFDLSQSDLETGVRYFWKVQAVVDNHSSLWSEAYTFTINNNTSIEENLITETLNFTFYPNPTYSKINVYNLGIFENDIINIKFANNYNIKIENMIGQIINNFEYFGNIYDLEIDMTKIPKGVYFITIFDNNNSLLTKGKVIKE